MQLRVVRPHLTLPRVGFVRRRSPVGAGFRRGHLHLSGKESLLVIAPHCDDETIAAGALLHDAVQLGCQITVAFVTNGDGFRYAAHRQYKKLVIPPEKQIEFAYLRQKESLRALAALGVQPAEVVFLGYPDRGLQALWGEAWEPERAYRSPFTVASQSPYRNSYTPHALYCGRSLADDIIRLIAARQPTHLVVPHPRDAHGDHSATFCFAIHALEEARQNRVIKHVQVLTYLIHRGPWPYPRGLHPRQELLPPPAFAGLHDRWLVYKPTEMAVAAKHRAVLQYRSQLNLLGRFLLSFVRPNELFGLYVPTVVRSVPTGAVFVDGAATEWPAGVGLLPDPVRDTITRNVEKGADVRSIAVCADPAFLYLRLEMHGRVVDEVRYSLWLTSCGKDRHRLHLQLKAPNQVLIRQSGQWRQIPDIVCRSSGKVIEVAVPRSLLGAARRVIMGAETRYRQIMVDRTAREVLLLPKATHMGKPILFCTASAIDIPGVAAVFARAFADEVERVLGSSNKHDVITHMFELLYETEPQALFIARYQGKVAGYVFAPVSLQRLWHTALVGGHLWRWFTNWLRGRYPIRFSAALSLLLDKYYFVRNALRDRQRIQHRILSVGVDPDAQGSGIATYLVQQALNRFERLGAPSVRLEVRPQNTPAVHVYTKLGFTRCGSMWDSRGEWWVMVKKLLN